MLNLFCCILKLSILPFNVFYLFGREHGRELVFTDVECFKCIDHISSIQLKQYNYFRPKESFKKKKKKSFLLAYNNYIVLIERKKKATITV